jgi:hypothetical protein
MDWNKRVNELNNELSEFWQCLHYDISDVIAEGLAAKDYAAMVIEDFFDNNPNLYDDTDKKYVDNLINKWAESEYEEYMK